MTTVQAIAEADVIRWPDMSDGQSPPAPPLPEVTPDRATLVANGVVGFDPLDLRARSFLSLRTQLINRFHRQGGRVLAVTSTQAGDGKTYVTANVAAALSRVHPTILVDLDLRRPTLAARFGLTVERGVEDYLSGEAEWRDIGVKVAATDLTIYGVRRSRPDSATLLASARLPAMFDRIRAMPGAPICIVDTPPILVVDDAVPIARSACGVLMIVEEGSTRGGDLDEALRMLSPAPIVGSVLNKSLTAQKIRRGYDYYDAPA